MWAYAYGRPKLEFAVELTRSDDLSLLSTEELARRADEVRKQLEEAAAIEAAIPAQYREKLGE